MSAISKVFSAELDGIEAKLIEVETDVNVGLHSFNIVGLADKALSEAKERVNSAIKSFGAKAPNRENRKIVVNLAPADVKKTGSQYDVAIALGYLLATEQMKKFEAGDKLFVGELALDGRLRPLHGALNIARLAHKNKFQYVFVPKVNAAEAAMVAGITVLPIERLQEVIDHLEDRKTISAQPLTAIATKSNTDHQASGIDISEIKGQEHAKRALMIAAAGGHNMLMTGAPGAGKTMLAQALNSILPAPETEEVIEMTQIYSAAGLLGNQPFVGERPFRSPHHTASPMAIVGGGQTPRPGEISLAHRGILFLDELPEFRRDLLEALRQPLESGKVLVSRVRGNLTFPAKFTLVAAMNPCPCGYYNDEEKACVCGAYEVQRYQKKVSGPLLDRIDLQITVPRVKIEQLSKKEVDYSEGERIREQVTKARAIQKARLASYKLLTNSDLSSKLCDKLIKLDAPAEAFVKKFFDKSLLSARGYYRVLKTAQTIADLEAAPVVTQAHLAEAFSYRLRTET